MRILIFLLLFCFYCFTERKEEEKGIKPILKKYSIEGSTMQYAVAPSNQEKLILFIHGSPGSLKAFSDYLEDKILQKKAVLISVDRYGYGGSNKGKAELSLANQAKSIAPILEKYRLPTLVIGHSYGGPVAVRLAMDYPKYISSVLLLAGSIDPELEKVLWYQKLANWRLVRFILPSFLDVSNQEILPLRFELKKMEHLWKNIKIPMTLIQGDNDSLVLPANVDYAQRMISDKTKLKIIRGDMNHFLPWNEYELVRKEILEMIEQN